MGRDTPRDAEADRARDGAGVTYWWSDLSGAELRARLTQRGVSWEVACALVRARETKVAADTITQVIGREPGR